MNCIDAIEGTVKQIIDLTYEDLILDRMDDTEYIRNIKVAIKAVASFIDENIEVTPHPEVMKKILYDYAKEKWMVYRMNRESKNTSNENDALMDSDYFYYYYDYIYDRGVQPY